MKRRDFITTSVGAGIVAGSGVILPASAEAAASSQSPQLQEGKLPYFWDRLTAPDFKTAVESAQGVCLVPIGVLEKHGPHLPLGTDVIRAHAICERAAQQEYCVVFPDFYVGQIFEAKHQPGTVAYSSNLMLMMLDETCKEIARNGLTKILLVNTHGGNNSFLPYFLQLQMESQRNYSVYLFQPQADKETQSKIASLRKSTTGGHADEVETGEMLAVDPASVKMDQLPTLSGADLNRLPLPHATTGIWWYARYPNHYAGNSAGATAELGEVSLAYKNKQLIEAIKTIKNDKTTIRLQNEFYEQSNTPNNTGSW
ncbi:MAG: creatininase family protein [Tannerellaceae bacterium]|jgi:creatinine amidohydrolase|nr:creatininase family protein [Tannerellaceae bacterium]